MTSGGHFSGAESQAECQDEQLCMPLAPPAQGNCQLFHVTNKGLLSGQFLSHGTPAIVSKTEKKIFFFLFHSPKSQAHKKEYKLYPEALISFVKNCYFQFYCLKKNSNAPIFKKQFRLKKGIRSMWKSGLPDFDDLKGSRYSP